MIKLQFIFLLEKINENFNEVHLCECMNVKFCETKKKEEEKKI